MNTENISFNQLDVRPFDGQTEHMVLGGLKDLDSWFGW